MFIILRRMQESEFCPHGHPSCILVADAPSKDTITTSSIRNNTLNVYQPSNNATRAGQFGWNNCIGAIIVSILLLIALGLWLAYAAWPRKNLWCWCVKRGKEKTTPKIAETERMGVTGEEMWLEGKDASMSPGLQYMSPVQTAGPMELGLIGRDEHNDEVGRSCISNTAKLLMDNSHRMRMKAVVAVVVRNRCQWDRFIRWISEGGSHMIELLYLDARVSVPFTSIDTLAFSTHFPHILLYSGLLFFFTSFSLDSAASM
jgi:hypothetical protein